MGGFSIWHWVIVLVVVVLVFGTGKLRNLGKDLGGAIKGFKDGIKEGGTEGDSAEAKQVEASKTASSSGSTIDVQAKEKS